MALLIIFQPCLQLTIWTWPETGKKKHVSSFFISKQERLSWKYVPQHCVPLAEHGKWAASWQNQQNDCASSQDSDQPGHPQMPRLIWVLAECTVILSVLSSGGSTAFLFFFLSGEPAVHDNNMVDKSVFSLSLGNQLYMITIFWTSQSSPSLWGTSFTW